MELQMRCEAPHRHMKAVARAIACMAVVTRTTALCSDEMQQYTELVTWTSPVLCTSTSGRWSIDYFLVVIEEIMHFSRDTKPLPVVRAGVCSQQLD
jgi:hypothetical protein